MKILYFLLLFQFFGLTARSQTWDWVASINNSSRSTLWASTSDKSGNLYLSGSFYDTLNISNQQYKCTNSLGCSYFTKLDVNGNIVWFKKELGSIFIEKIIVDIDGNIYRAGYVNTNHGNTLVLDNDSIDFLGDYEAFIAKYDSVGNLLWIKTAGGASSNTSVSPIFTVFDIARSIAVDTSGNVFVSGYVSDSAYFDNKLFVADTIPVIIGGAGFLAKYNALGVLQWVRKADTYWDVATDNDGNIFTNGFKANVLQHDSSGIAGWQNGTNTNSRTICTDSQGNVYFAGSFRDSVRFSNGAYFTNTTTSSAFAAKLSPTGNIIWATPLQNLQTSTFGYVDDHKVAVDSQGNVYMAGEFSGNLATPTDTVYGNTSIFVARISPNGVLESVATGGSNSNHDRLISLKADTNQVTIIGNTLNGFFGMHLISGDFVAKLSFPKVTGTSKALETNLKISVYPNPAKEAVTIKLPETITQAALQLYNLQGQKVLEQKLSGSQTELMLPKLASGCYLLQVQSQEQVWQQKLLIK